MSDDKVFADGIIFKQRGDNTPDFVIANFTLVVPLLAKWIKDNPDVQKGDYINLVAKIAKSGKPYVEVDMWEPKKRDEIDQSPPTDDDENLPFSSSSVGGD